MSHTLSPEAMEIALAYDQQPEWRKAKPRKFLFMFQNKSKRAERLGKMLQAG